MIRTEEEARKCWCPFVRFTTENEAWKAMSNREVPIANQLPGACNCIASECMAWRWAELPHEPVYEERYMLTPHNESNPPFSNMPDGFTSVASYSSDSYIARRETSRTVGHGFCGLAGKP